MKFEEAIQYLLEGDDTSYYTYNKINHKIEKNSIFINSIVEQSQMLRVVEILNDLGIKFEIELNGNIQLKYN